MEQRAYQPQRSLCTMSHAAAGAVEKATIDPMVANPPNNNAVQMMRAFMMSSPCVRCENHHPRQRNFEVR